MISDQPSAFVEQVSTILLIDVPIVDQVHASFFQIGSGLIQS